MLSFVVWFVQFSHLGNCNQAYVAVADPLPRHLLFGLWSSPVQYFAKSLKEVVANFTWVQSTIENFGIC